MSGSEAHDTFVDKWLAAEPWHRLLRVFEPEAQRSVRTAIECIGFELRQAALGSSDPRVAAAKLGWWAQEWTHVAAGTARHPLSSVLPTSVRTTTSLVDDGVAWVAAAAALAEDDSPADLSALLQRWQRFAAVQAAFAGHWLDAADDKRAIDAHAGSLLAERLPRVADELERGRLALPLTLLARHGLTRATLREGDARVHAAVVDHARDLAAHLQALPRSSDAYRQRQLALARLQMSQAMREPAVTWAGVHRLPALRSLWRAWRAH